MARVPSGNGACTIAHYQFDRELRAADGSTRAQSLNDTRRSEFPRALRRQTDGRQLRPDVLCNGEIVSRVMNNPDSVAPDTRSNDRETWPATEFSSSRCRSTNCIRTFKRCGR
jgi:hypothetical protein